MTNRLGFISSGYLDLVKAYEFAHGNSITIKNFLEAHRILSQTLAEAVIVKYLSL
jgi:hypothetical protein